MYPHERALVKRLASRPFVLLGINSDADREALKQTVVDERITWRSWWDNGGVDGPIQSRWQVAVRPTIHILDGNGVLRYKNVTEDAMDDAVDTLLDELEGRTRRSKDQ